VILDTRVVAGSGGGPDKTIINSPRFLSRTGYRMLCAYLHPPGDAGFEMLRRKAADAGTELLSVPDRGPLDWTIVPKMLELCRHHKVAVWHGHDYKTNALGLILNRWHPMRLVTTVHGWVRQTLRTPVYYAVDRACLPRYERVYCVSPDLHERCVALGVPESRCELLENGIDVDAYQRLCDTAAAKERLGLPPARPVIGAAGRLSPEKGFDLLLQAAADLRRRGHDLSVLIAGEGPERARLEHLARALGLGDRCRLLGYRADLRPIYEAMDVYALSSHREGLPNVLLEAMAMGVPVAATRINGVPRLVADGDNGLLVPPGDAAALAEVLGRLLRDIGLRRVLAAAGRQTVEGRYSFARRMGRLSASYDEMLRRN
jgi:glycosyltransferase involved in cell wall biosynthesis